MTPGQQIDRRQAHFRAFKLERPLFMQVPRGLAAPVILGCALIAILASRAVPTVEFGPFFLLICAFGAWFVGNRFAVSLGLIAALVENRSAHATLLHGSLVVTTLQLCSALAVVLMLGVARAALEIEWRLARIDQLTGALNRKAFFEAVADQAGQPGTVVLIYADVDGLKCLNDRLGHEAGDEGLVDFANRVRGAIRKSDVFARIGGDEFVVYLRVHDATAAVIVANRLNRALNIDLVAGDNKLRCSLGVLVLPTGSRSIDAELKQADALMYHAKQDRIGLLMATQGDADTHAVTPSASPATQRRQAVRASARPTSDAASLLVGATIGA